jgi:uncharacterized SAM-binding protein YcdF (DUF218 family)
MKAALREQSSEDRQTTTWERVQVIWLLSGSIGFFVLLLGAPVSLAVLTISFRDGSLTSLFANTFAATIVGGVAWLTLLFIPE